VAGIVEVRRVISRACAIGLNFLLLAAAMYFAARSVDDVLAMWWASPASSPARVAAAPPSPRHLVRASYDPIVERDVFNSVKQTAPGEPVVDTIDLHLKLVGTSHLSLAVPFAIIEDQRNSQQSLYKLGSEVADAGKLVTIDKERVLIDHAGQLVALEIPKNLSSASADGSGAQDTAEEYRRQQEKIIQEHRQHPQRELVPRPDRDTRQSQKEAEKAARRSAREARRAARKSSNPAAQPPLPPLAPAAGQNLLAPASPGNQASESD